MSMLGYGSKMALKWDFFLCNHRSRPKLMNSTFCAIPWVDFWNLMQFTDYNDSIRPLNMNGMNLFYMCHASPWGMNRSGMNMFHHASHPVNIRSKWYSNTNPCLSCHLAPGPAEADPATSLAQLFEFWWRFIWFRARLTPIHIARLQIWHWTNSFKPRSTKIAKQISLPAIGRVINRGREKGK